ncbi:MAG TPA: hypothetical protein VJ066_02715 [Candidatus Bathyarchaeia archaeon]|nr:hypothetical protein [Candidatus Bathyarchaeia archaeon]
MKTKTLIITSIFLLSLFGSALSVSAKTLAVGVAKGDVFYYEMYAHYASSNPNTVIKVPPFEKNNTDWVRIEITDVSGSIISHVYTVHFKDGNETRISSQTDLTRTSGWSNGFRGIPISPANLKADDTIPTGNLTVKETVMRVYPSSIRETNLATWNVSTDHGYCYFDRQTGMLVELNRVHLYINAETGEVISKTDIVTMISSSFWARAAFPVFLPPLVLLTVTAVGVASVERNFSRKKSKKEKKRSLAQLH